MFNTPYEIDFSNRVPHPQTDSMFVHRWSPRSFKKVEISENIRNAIFDAARWAPSSFGEQPWRIFTSSNNDEFDIFLDILVEENQTWAKNASLLGFMIAKNHFTQNKKENPWKLYDCGFAWASMVFQAQKFGLYSHGIAKYNTKKAYEILKVPKDTYTIVAGFAIGAIDIPENAPEEYKNREIPNSRKKLEDIYFPGGTTLN